MPYLPRAKSFFWYSRCLVSVATPSLSDPLKKGQVAGHSDLYLKDKIKINEILNDDGSMQTEGALCVTFACV